MMLLPIYFIQTDFREGAFSMDEKQVEVIKKVDGPVIRDRRKMGKPLTITRKRVAAYVRVSTNGEEQIQSFNSQKQYYQDKIDSNKEWVMVGIYADEGITGTKTTKREQFLKMIDDCMNGLIDIVITKSVSRFSRNLVDTLQYTRMLKVKGVTVIFEKENIDTSKMESEMQLSLLSALAQNEVESLSQNVTMGVQMKMSRGELMGFNGCLGYDYNPEDKSITINEAEAETVRLIYDLYLQGYGAYRIAKELTRLGKVNKKGNVKWTDSGVRGILKNEKYKGDLLMGKTYTVGTVNFTIAHECFHWHRHQPYHALMKMLGANDELGKIIQCSIGSNSKDSEKWKAIDWMEWQANGVAPHILMPTSTAKIKVTELIEKYQIHFDGMDGYRIEDMILELADFYGLSKLAVKMRIREMGYAKIDGVFTYVNGQ
jgi:DNA invertase Pin-like site-specific DNA recombinase